jgi:hypothetical protein
MCLQLQVEQLGCTARGDHDERLVHPDRVSIRDRRRHNVELGFRPRVQDVHALVEQRVEVGELAGPDTCRAGQVQQPMLALPQHPGHQLQDVIEALEPAQRGKGGSISGVLPRA